MNTINHYLAESVARRNENVFLIEQSTGEQLSYSSLGKRLGQVARVLTDQGAQRGDVVTLICKNSIDMVVMLYGVMAYGAIANPLNPQLTPIEVSNVIEHAESRIIFSDKNIRLDGFRGKRLDIAQYKNAPALGLERTLSEPLAEQDGAMLIYTSGTTGKPKGILLNHGNITYNVLTAIEKLALNSEHTSACILPLFHMFGFISDLSAMAFCGGKVVIMDVFDISKLAHLQVAVKEHNVNSFSAAPLMFELMVRFDCDLKHPSMKFCVSGAAPLRKEVAADFLHRYGVPIIPAYGLTESTCFATISPPDAINNKSIGLPANIEIKIVSDNGELGPHEIGELVLKGASIMQGGYFRGSSDCFLDSAKQWFRTGDLGYYDERGYFYITGRKKNMVIRGGEKIYLEDIDACLSDWATINDSATVSFQINGEEKIACFIALDRQARLGEAEIMSYIRTRMGDYKCPDAVIFADEIPRTPTNKARIKELQEMALNHHSQVKA